MTTSPEGGGWVKRLRALPEDVAEWPDDVLREYVEDRYEPSVIPLCRVCGGELSIQGVGGGRPTEYACDGMEVDPDDKNRVRYKEGRSPADDHFGQSQYTDYRRNGDSFVMEVLRRWKKITDG